MSWNEIIGHKRQVEVLRAAVASQRSVHAYLLVGESGVGKGLLGRVLAQALLCEADDASRRPCGTCRSCQRPLTEHPDNFAIGPHESSSIKIEQVRSVQHELAFRPAWQHRKVFRFDPADAMTEQAQNCLLKSLEEPPTYASFILMAKHLTAVLPTVRSRCVHVRLGRVAAGEIAQALQAQGREPGQARLLAALAFGRPGAVLDADAEAILAQRREIIEWALQMHRSRSAVWHVGEAFERERERAPILVDLLSLWYRDLLLVKGGKAEAIVNQDVADELMRAADQVSLNGVAQALRALMQLKADWDRNANFRLAVDVALINIQRGLRSA